MTVSETRPGPMPEPKLEPTEAIASMQDRLIDSVTAGQQEVLDAMESTGRAMIEGVDLTRRSLVDFVAERIRQDIDTQAALMRCRSLDEVRELRSRFLRKAVDQYAGEASRLIMIGRQLASRTLTTPRA